MFQIVLEWWFDVFKEVSVKKTGRGAKTKPDDGKTIDDLLDPTELNNKYFKALSKKKATK